MEATTRRDYERLSPFEIKDELIRLARAMPRGAAQALLNAGRGNPNWIATRAREVFFLLGQFAIGESRRVRADPAGLGGMPEATGIANRLTSWLAAHRDAPGAETAAAAVRHAVARFGFQPDAFVHELTDAIIGDTYPMPVRMLVHAEAVVHAYLLAAMCGEPAPAGRFDLFAVEGATAAICDIFRSLRVNRLLRTGDRVALGTPIFTPYLELPRLAEYGLEPVCIEAPEANGFQYPEAELAKLLDPSIKAFLLVNPGNPTSVALSQAVRAQISEIVRTRRPDLMLVTDDVYATFVDNHRSLLGELPRNTIGVYSYSKYFGCTGWRLGVVAVHQDNVFDQRITALPEAEQALLDARYATVARVPRALKFIDRMVADSRDVALNHTAGLSAPQQAMMTLFSLIDLTDTAESYRRACVALLRDRAAALDASFGRAPAPEEGYDFYYGLIDLAAWLREQAGPEAERFMRAQVHPLDIVFRLAEEQGIVLLNGGGFHAPNWSVRISFANLDEAAYTEIGRALRAIAEGYAQAWRAARVGGAAAQG